MLVVLRVKKSSSMSMEEFLFKDPGYPEYLFLNRLQKRSFAHF